MAILRTSPSLAGPSPVGDSTSGGTTTRRRHTRRQPFDRGELERQGWRTTLDYCENLERGVDGRLRAVEPRWSARAERIDATGTVRVVDAIAPSPAAAFRRLRAATTSARPGGGVPVAETTDGGDLGVRADHVRPASRSVAISRRNPKRSLARGE